MISRKERSNTMTDTVLAAMAGNQAEIWTAMPGIIQAVHPNQTCDVQISTQIKYTNPVDGSISWIQIPKLLDCPLHFPRGGGCILTFPVMIGDECLVVFASRCIDAWWQSGGHNNNLPDNRMHDLSDGFAFVGFSSVPNVPSSISTTSVQLKSIDGGAVVDLNPSTHAISITATTINLNGTVNINGNVATTGTVTNNGHAIDSTHKHSGVQTGLSNTGVPT